MRRGEATLWFGFGGVVALAGIFWLTSCGGAIPPAKRAQAVSCLDIANAALQEAHSCDQARTLLAQALTGAPQCMAIFGLHVNLEAVDGGDVVRCDD